MDLDLGTIQAALSRNAQRSIDDKILYKIAKAKIDSRQFFYDPTYYCDDSAEIEEILKKRFIEDYKKAFDDAEKQINDFFEGE